ncbi:putative tRNA pseudouridine synthase tag-124 [Clavelina lepadiformis]|uniref:Pseudouridine synthase I TruA alpha/beta domain-containing protein n=1 Tax=Clavelina lepadiformis TaxID=159417 RepID=A0ABP0GTF8_CLALP
MITIKSLKNASIIGKHFMVPARHLAVYQNKTSRNSNYEFLKLREMTRDRLVYKVIKLQRLLDTYYWMHNPGSFDGRDKVRVDHPDPEDIILDVLSERTVAFKVLYLGWDYAGYAWQDSSWGQKMVGHTNVVERVFLEALLRQQLVPNIGSRRLNFERCGRTDRDVSGLSQVISLRLRSNLNEGYGVWGKTETKEYDEDGNQSDVIRSIYCEDGFSISDTSLDHNEFPYVKMLNDALPSDIRVLAWSPVRRNFTPRYHCMSRTYRYVFPRGGMDIKLMQEAASKLVGKHDFRNFCTKHSENVFKHFKRDIFSFKVEEITNSNNPECDMCSATVSGSSFLYHQIRCMMSLLGLVGLKRISPSVIDDLLDVEKSPKKPGFSTFNAINLTLVDTEFKDEDICWRWDEDVLESSRMLARNYNVYSAKSETIRHMYDHVCSRLTNQNSKELAALEFSENLGGVDHDQTHEYHGVSPETKTLEEARTKYKQSIVKRLINKGAYRRAALAYQSPMPDEKNTSAENEQNTEPETSNL